jgi:hypothetical protein
MLYAILCYSDEVAMRAKPKAQDDALLADLEPVQRKLCDEGKLGPHLRLMPTTAATTLRYGKETVVLDGPFAETKEQLLGFYVVECANFDEAIEVGQRLLGPRIAHGGAGALEIRPVAMSWTGGSLK